MEAGFYKRATSDTVLLLVKRGLGIVVNRGSESDFKMTSRTWRDDFDIPLDNYILKIKDKDKDKLIDELMSSPLFNKEDKEKMILMLSSRIEFFIKSDFLISETEDDIIKISEISRIVREDENLIRIYLDGSDFLVYTKDFDKLKSSFMQTVIF